MTLHEFQNRADSRRPHLLLLGHPVSHSLSPLMHNTAAEHLGLQVRYFAIDLEQNQFSTLSTHLRSEFFRGANVTIPYKEALLEYVDRLDDLARKIGAINVIYKKGNSLVGANTDVYGFLHPLKPYRKRLEGSRAIIFGTGGASKAIIAGLFETGVSEIVLISRKPSKLKYDDNRILTGGYHEWPVYARDAAIIINTTPLGMEPDLDSSPVMEEEAPLLVGKICYDIVYNPLKTKFLALAEDAGAETVGGLGMLIYQGARAFELWTGHPFPIDLIKQQVYAYFE